MAKKPKAAPATQTGSGGQSIHRRNFVGPVRVGLAPQDRDPLCKELTSKLRTEEELGKEAAQVAAGYRKKLKEVAAEIKELALKLDQGVPEDMELEEVKDFKKKTVTIFRTDTKAIIEKREMTDKDFQLDLGGKAGDDEEKDDDQDVV